MSENAAALAALGRHERWWKTKAHQAHVPIVEALRRIEPSVAERNDRWRRYLGELMDATVHGWTPGQLPTSSGFRTPRPNERRLSLNPIESCLSTLASHHASQRIRPRVLTSTGPGRWALREQAEKLEKAILGEWSQSKVHRRSVKPFMWAGALGAGAMKVLPHCGRVMYEPTFPGELLVDEAACLTSGEPRTLYQAKWVAAEVLEARFPGAEHGKAIERAIGRNISLETASATVTSHDLVLPVEAWHLPSSHDAEDGRHVICLEDHTLLDEPWPLDRFPFAWMFWTAPILGFWPQGLVERQEGAQHQVQKLLSRIQEAVHLASVLRVYVQKGTKLPRGHLSNLQGAVVYYDGPTPPKVETPPSIAADAYGLIWDLYGKVFEGVGLNQLSASGKIPPGVEAAVAIREVADQQSGRFALLSQAVEDYYVDLAELTVWTAKALAAQSKGGYRSRYQDPAAPKGGFEEIDWAEIDLDRDRYELAVFPASYLPHTPAGRLSTVQEMLQAGFIGPEEGVALLGFPDLEHFRSLKTAALADIDRQISLCLRGEPQEPLRYHPVDQMLQRATSALFRARADGAPPPAIAALEKYIERAEDLAAALAEPPEQAGGPPMPGPAAPGPEMPTPIPPPQAPGMDLATPAALLE